MEHLGYARRDLRAGWRSHRSVIRLQASDGFRLPARSYEPELSGMSSMPFNAKMSDSRLSRRDFLKLTRTVLLTASGILGLSGLIRFLSYQSQSPKPTEFDLGLASDYAPGSRTILPQVPGMLIRTEKVFTALSLVCPHLGCTVNVTSNGFTCPCHGSRFLPDGSLRNGPASRPLTMLLIEENSEQHLILYTQ